MSAMSAERAGARARRRALETFPVDAEFMTAADEPPERSHQGIDEWARHGVEEFEEREAVERAELGEESEPDRVS
jgi:hypothetical protein